MERRWIPPVLLAVALLTVLIILKGCGSGSGEDGGGAATRTPTVLTPRDEAFAYVPPSAALVVEARTDLASDSLVAAGEMLKKVAQAPAALDALRKRLLGGLGQPAALTGLYSNPIVVWIQRSRPLSSARACASWVTADPAVLADLVSTEVGAGALAAAGSYRRASLYTRRKGGVYAVRDATVVTCPDDKQLRAALERRTSARRSAHLSAAVYDARLRRLPAELRAPDETFATATLAPRVLGIPKDGRELVPWLGAIRGLVLAGSVHSDGLHVAFVLATDADAATEQDLPLVASQDTPLPQAPSDAKLVIGVRDARQVVYFAERVARAVTPDAFAQLESTFGALRKLARVDVERNIFDQLLGEATVTVDPADGSFTVRAELDDPQLVARTLRGLSRVNNVTTRAAPPAPKPVDINGDGTPDPVDSTTTTPTAAVGPGLQTTDLGNDAYSVTFNNSAPVTVAVRDYVLLLTSQTGADLDALAAEGDSPTALGGTATAAQGALLSYGKADAVAGLLARHLHLGAVTRRALGNLGDSVLSARAKRSGIVGELVMAAADGAS